MKKSMWLWCLIAAFGLSINVACSDDEKETTPTPEPTVKPTDKPTEPAPSDPVVEPTPTDTTVTVEAILSVDKTEIEVSAAGGEITFVTTTNVNYTVSEDAEWITITSDGRAETADYTVTATVAANEGEAREAVITVSAEGAEAKTVTVKQAAYVAPEPTVPDPTVPDPTVPDPTVPDPTQPAGDVVSVTLEVYPGTAPQKVDAAEVATKLGVEDLAAAIADGTVTYVGLNADGTVYTAADGSTPSSTTNGTGHWYNSEYNPIVWGTPDPNGTGAVRFAYIEGDGATFTLGFDNAGGLVEGDSHKIAAKYIYGETAVAFEVVINVIAKPETPAWEMPEPDYVYSAELEHNTSWFTCSWAMSAEDEIAILAALGLDGDYNWEGAMADAVAEGAVIIKGFNADGTLTENVVSDHTGNTGYWFAEDGTVSTYGSGTMCADNFVYNGGTMCILGSLTEGGNTYPGYYVYTAGDSQVIVKLECIVTTPPPAPVFEVVGTYEREYATTNPGMYTTPDPQFSIEDIMPDIQDMIGGEPDTFQMGLPSGEFQGWNVTDGWFGADGAANWGSQEVMFCLKPTANGTFSYCAAINDGAVNAMCIYRYGNSATMKAVDVTVTVNLQ